MDSSIKAINDYWAMRCRLDDAHKWVSQEDIARFRKDYANVFRSYIDEEGNRVYNEDEIQFEAYEYHSDKDIAAYIHQGQTPKGLADIMSM